MQNSGTNYVTTVLKKYFDSNVTLSNMKIKHECDVREGFVAWKHNMQRTQDVRRTDWSWNLDNYSDTLVVAITRNPIDQAFSWHRENSKAKTEKAVLKAAQKEYITTECTYAQKQRCKFRNIFSWRKRYMNMLQELQNWFPRVVIVRHEDVMCPDGAIQFVKNISSKFPLCYNGKEVSEETISFTFHRGEQRSRGRTVSCESLERGSSYFNPHLKKRCQILSKSVDWESETQYSPFCNKQVMAKGLHVGKQKNT